MENNVLNVSILNSLIIKIKYVNIVQINKFMMSNYNNVSPVQNNIHYLMQINVINAQITHIIIKVH